MHRPQTLDVTGTVALFRILGGTRAYPCGGARLARRRQSPVASSAPSIPPLSCATRVVCRVPVPRPVAVGRRRAPLGKTAKGRVVCFLWDVRGLNGRCSHATRECWMERSGLSNASTTVFLASHGLRALFVLLLFYARFDFLQMRPPVLLFLLQ